MKLIKLHVSADKANLVRVENNFNIEPDRPPLGACSSFANHNIFWIHDIVITLHWTHQSWSAIRLLHWYFSNLGEHLKMSFIQHKCADLLGNCQSPQINLLRTIWQTKWWPITDSLYDLIVAGISLISLGLYWNWKLNSYKSNALVIQKHIFLFGASSHFTDDSTTDLVIVEKSKSKLIYLSFFFVSKNETFGTGLASKFYYGS